MRLFHPVIWKVIEWYAGKDLKRERVKSIVEMFVDLDLRTDLYKIKSQAFILVGNWDIYHFRPAKIMLQEIKERRLILIKHGHHETNRSSPAEIAHQVKRAAREIEND